MKYYFPFLVTLLIPGIALALPPDVPSGSWYSESLTTLIGEGAINENENFRPSDKATRAEFIEILVKSIGPATKDLAWQDTATFDDVSSNYLSTFERAAREGWLKGENECVGTHPCYARPNLPINRAEAAALIIRAFNLRAGKSSPSFTDNDVSQWFSEFVNTAASRCVLQGDGGASRVRPADNMNRAEMIVMVQRARAEGIEYPNCDAASSSDDVVGDDVVNANEERTCTVADWDCSDWSDCYQGVQKRYCNSTLYCRMHFDPPTLQRECETPDDPLIDLMDKNIEEWRAIHEEMLAAAKELATQNKAANEGIARIAAIESEWVSRFNRYVAIYNRYINLTPDQLEVWNEPKAELGKQDHEDLGSIPSEMDRLETQFRAVPKVWYNTTPTTPSTIYVPVPVPIPVPTTPTYNQESHQQMCDRMSGELALSGGFGSQDGLRQLYNAGCTTLQQYCNSYALSGIPQYLWDAECR